MISIGNAKIIDISDWQTLQPEEVGAREKIWVQSPEGEKYIFKEKLRKGAGEDWAEVIACELANKLGMPHAHYMFATKKGVSGVLTPSFLNENTLVLGNELLYKEINKNYERESKAPKEHTVEAISMALNHLKPPKDIAHSKLTAKDIFAGYLFFDVLIANQDRHHENWAITVERVDEKKSNLYLAPTYDHGSSLAYNLLESDRINRLETNDTNRQIPIFSMKTKSAIFRKGEEKVLSLREALTYFCEYNKISLRVWRASLEKLSIGMISGIIEDINSDIMTDIEKQFTIQLVKANRVYLLNEQ